MDGATDGTDSNRNDVNSALAALMQDPETIEDTEESGTVDGLEAGSDGSNQTEDELDTSDDSDGGDYLEIDDDDFATKYKYKDEEFTLRELIEARNNAALTEILEQEREEIESLREQLDTQRKTYEYLEFEEVPHKFLTGALGKMVKDGTMPKELYMAINDLFADAIQKGIYDPQKIEQVHQTNRERQAIEHERKSVQSEREQARIEREIADVQANFGSLTPAISAKLLDYMKGQMRKGKSITLIDAAKANPGLFSTPPASKRKLADRHRIKQPAKPNTMALTRKDALKAFYQ
jgi:hypothetical protein